MNISKIKELINYSYKSYNLLQNPKEILEFCNFYNELNCKNVLEIGSFFGGTFFLLCKLSNIKGKKISLDYPLYEASVHSREKIEESMKKFSEDVHVLTLDSHKQSTIDKIKETLNGEELDFIFIDGDHSYEGVKLDYEMYIPFLKDGGYVAFHDINDTDHHKKLNCHVAKFWNELPIDHKIEFNAYAPSMGIGVIQVFKHKRKLNMEVSFEDSGKINIYNKDFSELDLIVSVRDRDTKIPIYFTNLKYTKNCNSYYIIPLINYDFLNDENFSGFLIEYYDVNKNLIDSTDLKIKDRTTPIQIKCRNYSAFDGLFLNYKQFFYDKIYDNLDLSDISTVVDIGANVGLFTNYISYKNVKLIHAIEPSDKAFEELKKQFYYYNCVKCHKMGIHYFNGSSKLYCNPSYTILNGFVNKNSQEDTEETIEVFTLPTFLNNNGLLTVDLIKIDIEGLEYEVLNSMNDTEILRSKSYIIEYHMNNSGKSEILQKRFSSLGYAVTNFPDKIGEFINNKIALQGFFFARKY